MRRFPEAIGNLQAAVSINRSIGNLRGEADSLADLGRVHLDRGETAAATRHLVDALLLHRERGDARDIAITLIHLGLASLDAAQPLRALRELQEAHTLIAAHVDTDPYNYARALIALGKANVHTGDHESALGHLTEGLAIMEKFGSEYRLAEVRDLLGQIAQARGEVSQAERHYMEALRLYRALDAQEADTMEERLQGLGVERRT
jgi:tetratricopeptide (TPR) repeat protein